MTTDYGRLGHAELIELCARTGERAATLEHAIVQAIERIRDGGVEDVLTSVWSLLESALVQSMQASVIAFDAETVRYAREDCDLLVRTMSRFQSRAAEPIESPITLEEALERLKRAAITLEAAEKSGDDREHSEAECDIWAAGIAYGVAATACTPTENGRRCATHHNLPLYPSGRCLEGGP